MLFVAGQARSAAGGGKPQAIDTRESTITVHVFKAGVFSAFGHDHNISAPIAGGTVDTASRRVELRVRSGDLRVRDANTSEEDRSRIQKTMLGPEVLDVKQYPEIVFRSTGLEPAGGGSWSVRGNLTLHGTTRPVTVDVKEKDGHYVGATRFRQTEFDIKPVKVAGGTVRVKDELRIEFDIQLRAGETEARLGRDKP